MKISHIETRRVVFPAGAQLASSSATIDQVETALVVVHTDAGVSGFGYAYLLGGTPITAVVTLLDWLGSLLVGRDANDIDGAWALMWRACSFIGPRGLSCFAIAALDTALWDIRGRVRGLPVWRLLGATQARVPAYYSGLFLNAPLEALRDEAQAAVAAGWRAVKMRLGARLSIAENEARVAAVRDAIGADVALLADASRQLDRETAIAMGKMLAAYDLGWYEDPVSPDELDDHAAVCAAVAVDVCTGEMAYSRYDFQLLLEKQAADIWMPDLERVGGVTEWLRVGALAAQHDIRVAAHVFQEYSAHVLAALPTGWYVEALPLWDRLFVRPLAFADGMAVLTEAPGFGLELDMDFVSKYTVTD